MVVILPPTHADAHPVSVTKSLIYVTREQLTAKVEVLLEDLFLFHQLKPNDQDFLEPDVIEQGIELHREFLLERFVIQDYAGNKLDSRVTSIERPDYASDGVALAALMSKKLVFHVEFDLLRPPEFLTFIQSFTDKEVLIRSEMQLEIKQEGAGTPIVHTIRAEEAYTIDLSWDNPPLSPDASEAERQEWMTKREEETLGITSYSSVYSFLYIEDYEVRHEILVPLLTLEESILLARDDDDFLDLAEQDAARRQVEAFFVSGNPIEIDGARVTPSVQRCDFYGLDFRDFAMQGPRRPVSLATARVGIILTYSTRTPPNSVTLTWNRFNEFIWAVDMVVCAGSAASRVALSRLGDRNVFDWQRAEPVPTPAPPDEIDVLLPPPSRWSIPVVSLAALLVAAGSVVTMTARRGWSTLLVMGTMLGIGVAAAGWSRFRIEVADPLRPEREVTSRRADEIFTQLHGNVFRAFDYRHEDDIYDALAKSTDGELLNELYLQIRRGLVMAEQGGAVSRIREVSIVEGRKEPSGGQATDSRAFQYRCQWTIGGTVEHWGHVHSRTNRYDAVWLVEPRGDVWKVTSLELLDERPGKLETNLRKM